MTTRSFQNATGDQKDTSPESEESSSPTQPSESLSTITTTTTEETVITYRESTSFEEESKSDKQHTQSPDVPTFTPTTTSAVQFYNIEPRQQLQQLDLSRSHNNHQYQSQFTQKNLINLPQYYSYYQPPPLTFTDSQGHVFANPYYYSWPYYYQVNNQYNQFNQFSSVNYPYNPNWQQFSGRNFSSQTTSLVPTRFLSTSSDNQLHFPRGPPRKPPQSGHALWVGNLPSDTKLMELCALFGTEDILSVFLIEKTKCAFVNYATSSAVKEGISAFQKRGGKLRGNTLLVKPRETAQSHQISPNSSSSSSSNLSEISSDKGSSSQVSKKNSVYGINDDRERPKDRYFICKSLTVEDLKASINLGIWSTQSHNEEILNDAFRTCENVYIFFSANRARNFYGYARMETEIPTSPTYSVQQSSTTTTLSPSPMSHPNTIETKADPSIPLPAGRIVDDSSRGCLFWEAISVAPSDEGSPGQSNTNNWTSPFKIRWMSPVGKTLPFEKTINLFNPLNENKPVKIARDGTEVSFEIGKELSRMFHD